MRGRPCLLAALALTLLYATWPVGLTAEAPAGRDALAQDLRPFLAKHCAACHANGKKKGGFDLDQYPDAEAFAKGRKTWETALRLVRAGEMPPPEKPRPDPADVLKALNAIDATLAKFDCTGPRQAGRVTLRRLNRVEYNNTIRDLVGVDFQPAATFPQDDSGYGFDNIGDVLSVSPLLLEKYLQAAETILERAIVIADPPQPQKQTFRGGALRPFPRGVGDQRGRMGVYLHSKGDVVLLNTFDAGDYNVKVLVFGQQMGDESVKIAVKQGGKELRQDTVAATQDKPATLTLNLKHPGGPVKLAVAFLNPYQDPKVSGEKGQRLLFVREVEVDGPYNPPPVELPETHKRLLAHAPGLAPREAAREILTRFARRAFRRTIQPAEIDRLLKLYDRATKEGLRFELAMRHALAGALVSPHFLFRVEADPPTARAGQNYPVSEFALASRLSYFLWSSMPDEELLQTAERGELRKHLEAQVRRMLKDPKSAAFVENFAGQWLTIRNLANVAPDHKQFPNFDEPLRAAMAKETELFFDAVLREDRSVLDFLDGDFTFVNDRLAKHYGIDGVKGAEFRRVKAPPHRLGILTQASILTLTSNPMRTSPVKRGKWVLEQILGTPPPPPPPDVPDLKEDEHAQLSGSLRQRMEQHRQKAICASCHNRLDPLGFAFENFDAVGAWRTKDGKFAIDPSGVLPDGKTFQGPAEFVALLKGQQKEQFCRNLIEKVLTYALGRGLEYYDRCAVDGILAKLPRQNYRLTALLLEVITSEPFQMRTAKGNLP
jgi:cytochrome c553